MRLNLQRATVYHTGPRRTVPPWKLRTFESRNSLQAFPDPAVTPLQPCTWFTCPQSDPEPFGIFTTLTGVITVALRTLGPTLSFSKRSVRSGNISLLPRQHRQHHRRHLSHQSPDSRVEILRYSSTVQRVWVEPVLLF